MELGGRKLCESRHGCSQVDALLIHMFIRTASNCSKLARDNLELNFSTGGNLATLRRLYTIHSLWQHVQRLDWASFLVSLFEYSRTERLFSLSLFLDLMQGE
jgi:hypothetical protein